MNKSKPRKTRLAMLVIAVVALWFSIYPPKFVSSQGLLKHRNQNPSIEVDSTASRLDRCIDTLLDKQQILIKQQRELDIQNNQISNE